MSALPEPAATLIAERAREPGPVLWLTGAGISAESGVPTFRGEEGYWKVGSKNYQPQDLATFAAFSAMPDDVWAWYLYRRGVCRGAEPNEAHRALVRLERAIGDRFQLVTQNVDGLHQRAGTERVFAIHGNIDQMRPVGGVECVPIPDAVPTEWPRGRKLSDLERDELTVGGRPARPHVLWFDECYDEERFRFESSLLAAASASLLVVVGTTGATNLPMQIGMLCAKRGTPSIVVNPEPNPFSEMVEHTGAGLFLEGTAGQWVPLVCEAMAAAYTDA